MKKLELSGVTSAIEQCKDNKNPLPNNHLVSIYKDIANQAAVQQEIGDVIRIFNEEIKLAKQEVLERKAASELKYKQRGFFSQDLNATIKERLINRMGSDPSFNNKLVIKYNSGVPYFVVKSRYILYVKRLYGNFNKPNSYPTPKSDQLFNGTLFSGESLHIPVLFIGPNLGNISKNDAFVTSLISKYEVNWSTESYNLFDSTPVVTLKQPRVAEVESDKEVLKLKPGLGKAKTKNVNNK